MNIPGSFDDDENVKMMRQLAGEIGLTQLLLDVRRDLQAAQTTLDRDRAMVTQALALLGVTGKEQR